MVRYHTMRAFFHALSIFSYFFQGPRFLVLESGSNLLHLFTDNLLCFAANFNRKIG